MKLIRTYLSDPSFFLSPSRALTSSLLASGVFLCASSAEAGIEDESTPDDPEAIYNGQEADTCAWPTTVAVSGGGGLCTGTLIHPRVVVYAAHCGDEGKQIIFGESLNASKRITPEFCKTNPRYGGTNDQGNDWAVCKLPYDIDLPVTPAITGNCERGILQAGETIVIAGFGNSDGDTGSGRKRWAETRLHFANYESNTAVSGGGMLPTIGSGDSGGPAFIRYPDGSWHAFGIASTGSGTTGSGTHCLIAGAMPWLEEETGMDLTPCFNDEGEWEPTSYCRDHFSGETGVGEGIWGRTWCEGTESVAWSEMCGDTFVSRDEDVPTVEIVSPEHLDRVDENESVTIEVDAQDDLEIRDVVLKINGDLIEGAVDTREPFEFAGVSFPEGVFELSVVTRDYADNEVESEVVTLLVGDVEAPASGDEETGGTGGEDDEDGDSDDEGDEDSTKKSSSGGSTKKSSGDSSSKSGCQVDTNGNPLPVAISLFAFGFVAWRRRSA